MSNGGIIGPVQNPIIYANSTVTSFTASGTFSARSGQTTVDYLVVAGGGAGGLSGPLSYESGGGGAGGLRTETSFPISSSIQYPITVGGGGSASNGSPSIFSTITSTGGGFGGPNGTACGNTGSPGGSGGGGGQGGATPPVAGGGGNAGTSTGNPGTANTGGGGGGISTPPPSAANGAGGSGIVLIKQPAGTFAPGVWSLSEAYNYKKAGNWTS